MLGGPARLDNCGCALDGGIGDQVDTILYCCQQARVRVELNAVYVDGKDKIAGVVSPTWLNREPTFVLVLSGMLERMRK